MTDNADTTQVYRVFIKASPEAIWDAITKPEWTERYAYGGRVELDLKAGGNFCHRASEQMKSMGMVDEMIVGEVVEADPPKKLVQTWHPVWIRRAPPNRIRASPMRSRRSPAACAR
jgi:uncharacterized protein YndB with AHSA1/START domain